MIFSFTFDTLPFKIYLSKRQTMIYTQFLPQWNLSPIVPFSRCINFHIFFLCFNDFFIKRQDICQCKSNNLVFGNATSSHFLLVSYFLLDFSIFFVFVGKFFLVFVNLNVFSSCEFSAWDFYYTS